jgi:uncharacterized protein (DUF433 family)
MEHRRAGAYNVIRGTDMSKQYVRTDEHGVMRVGETRISIDSVMAGFLRGDAPESIQRQYPGLSLEQVYGAITYYLAHKDEVDAYLARQDKIWEDFRRECDRNPPPVVV